MPYDCLIIEGGGFKTAFTCGILDAFISHSYMPFKTIAGISGGSVAMSYYMSMQYRQGINSMLVLVKTKNFTDFKKAFSPRGYLDIDFLATVAKKKAPFNLKDAIKCSKKVNPYIVVTNRKSGKPEYHTPDSENWISTVIASSTLPFATKGEHKLKGEVYFDGGWSDPIPVKWAIKNGSKKILVLRTRPKDAIVKQSWADYFGSKYFKTTPKLAATFEKGFEYYNNAVELMQSPPKGVKIDQIAPKKFLKSGTYSYSKASLMLDYRYGLDKGIMHLNKLKK